MVKGEPYWQPSVSSPPRLSPHVTSSSRPTKDGRLAAWSGIPPEDDDEEGGDDVEEEEEYIDYWVIAK